MATYTIPQKPKTGIHGAIFDANVGRRWHKIKRRDHDGPDFREKDGNPRKLREKEAEAYSLTEERDDLMVKADFVRPMTAYEELPRRRKVSDPKLKGLGAVCPDGYSRCHGSIAYAR